MLRSSVSIQESRRREIPIATFNQASNCCNFDPQVAFSVLSMLWFSASQDQL